jgi:hypothetical protein
MGRRKTLPAGVLSRAAYIRLASFIAGSATEVDVAKLDESPESPGIKLNSLPE